MIRISHPWEHVPLAGDNFSCSSRLTMCASNRWWRMLFFAMKCNFAKISWGKEKVQPLDQDLCCPLSRDTCCFSQRAFLFVCLSHSFGERRPNEPWGRQNNFKIVIIFFFLHNTKHFWSRRLLKPVHRYQLFLLLVLIQSKVMSFPECDKLHPSLANYSPSIFHHLWSWHMGWRGQQAFKPHLMLVPKSCRVFWVSQRSCLLLTLCMNAF